MRWQPLLGLVAAGVFVAAAMVSASVFAPKAGREIGMATTRPSVSSPSGRSRPSLRSSLPTTTGPAGLIGVPGPPGPPGPQGPPGPTVTLPPPTLPITTLPATSTTRCRVPNSTVHPSSTVHPACLPTH